MDVVDFKISFWLTKRRFTRGWTLQELLAPSIVEFFSLEGERLGDKQTLIHQIHAVTRIVMPALKGTPLPTFSVAERMSWAANRITKREEDAAYSLFGLFVWSLCLVSLICICRSSTEKAGKRPSFDCFANYRVNWILTCQMV
jgi:hypothetical protein